MARSPRRWTPGATNAGAGRDMRTSGSRGHSIQLTVTHLAGVPMAAEGPRRPYNSERRRDAARHTRAAVLDACRELLFQDGYHNTTIRAVAERAGVSAETVYKAFGGKPGMVKALWHITLAGDDEPVPMADRPQTREILRTSEPGAKLRLYAAYVRGIHERIAALFTLLTQA